MSQDSDQLNHRRSASELFSNTSYLAHARKLDAKPGAWIATDDLMAAIIANSKQPIPQSRATPYGLGVKR